MTLKSDDRQYVQLSQAEFQELLKEKVRAAVRLTFVTILEEEVALFGRATLRA